MVETLEAGEFLEREAGGRHQHAGFFVDLQVAAEHVYEILRDDDERDEVLMQTLALIRDYEFRV